MALRRLANVEDVRATSSRRKKPKIIKKLMVLFGHRSKRTAAPEHISDEGNCSLCFEALTNETVEEQFCCGMILCKQCLLQHITTRIESGDANILCPNYGCNKDVIHEEILHLLSDNDALRKKYVQLFVDLNRNPHMKTCPRCKHITAVDPVMLMVAKDVEPPLVKCIECKLDWCFDCHAPMHANLTCEEFKNGDRQLDEWMRQRVNGVPNAQRCPKCNVMIQKTEGCNHITHTTCNTHFCYVCGEEYDGFNSGGGLGTCGCNGNGRARNARNNHNEQRNATAQRSETAQRDQTAQRNEPAQREETEQRNEAEQPIQTTNVFGDILTIMASISIFILVAIVLYLMVQVTIQNPRVIVAAVVAITGLVFCCYKSQQIQQ